MLLETPRMLFVHSKNNYDCALSVAGAAGSPWCILTTANLGLWAREKMDIETTRDIAEGAQRHETIEEDLGK